MAVVSLPCITVKNEPIEAGQQKRVKCCFGHSELHLQGGQSNTETYLLYCKARYKGKGTKNSAQEKTLVFHFWEYCGEVI